MGPNPQKEAQQRGPLNGAATAQITIAWNTTLEP